MLITLTISLPAIYLFVESIYRWQPFVLNKIYHCCPVFFFISKTVAMFLVSSTIHENSLRPMKILRTIPTERWTAEVRTHSFLMYNMPFDENNLTCMCVRVYVPKLQTERFSEQVCNETTTLSEMGFFVMSKTKFLDFSEQFSHWN